MGWCELESSVVGQKRLADCYGHGNGLSGSINDVKYLDQLSDYKFLKTDSAQSIQLDGLLDGQL